MLKASILIAQMMIKFGVSTTKLKYSTQIWLIKMFTICVSWRLHVNLDPLKIRTSPLTTWFGQNARKESYVAKADLLILFANQMNWGSTWKKVMFGIIKRKMWSKCYCSTPKRQQFTIIKCKVQNNWKIQKTQTSVTSTYESRTKKVIHSQVDFQQKLSLMLILQAMDQFPK